VRGLTVVCTVRSGEVVEPLPFVEFSLEIDIAFVTEKLIEFLLIEPVGPLNFAVQLRCSALNVSVSDPKIFDMPMELGLELVTTICTHFANAEWEFFNDVVNEVDHCPACYAQHVREGAFACVCFSLTLRARTLVVSSIAAYWNRWTLLHKSFEGIHVVNPA